MTADPMIDHLAERLHTVMEWSLKADKRGPWDALSYAQKDLVRYWVSDLLDELRKVS